MKILNVQKQAFVQNLEKAFQGQGVYQDNYKNRKLGRVGQPYKKETSSKEESEKENPYFSKLNESLIRKYSDKIESVSLADIEEKYRDFITDRGQEPTRKFYAKEASKLYNKLVKEWNNKKVENDDNKNIQTKNKNGLLNLIQKTDTLKNAKGARLDAIIAYSNSDGVDGIKVKEGASDRQKRIAIAKFYKKAAENDASNLDEIVEDALADYVPNK